MHRTLILLSILLSVAACDQIQPQETGSSELTVSEALATETQSLNIEVHQGTNMAVDVSLDGSQIVSSIQGTLFTMSADGGNATALEDLLN